jgi:hypothetical protein
MDRKETLLYIEVKYLKFTSCNLFKPILQSVDLGGEPQTRHILFEISSIFLLSERILETLLYIS